MRVQDEQSYRAETDWDFYDRRNFRIPIAWPTIIPSFSSPTPRQLRHRINSGETDVSSLSDERILRMLESIEFFENVIMDRETDIDLTRHKGRIKDASIESNDDTFRVETWYDHGTAPARRNRIFTLNYDPDEDDPRDPGVERDYLEHEFENKGLTNGKELPVAEEDLRYVASQSEKTEHKFPGSDWNSRGSDWVCEMLLNDEEVEINSVRLAERKRDGDDTQYEFVVDARYENVPDVPSEYRIRLNSSIENERELFHNTKQKIFEEYDLEDNLEVYKQFGFA